MLIQTIQDALTRQMYEGTSGTVIPRGLAYPLDPFLLGTPRFAKKLGFEYAVLVPDNMFTLAEDAIFLTDRLVLDRAPTWINPGDYVSIGRRELHRVDDVSSNTIILVTRLIADHLANSYVYHYCAAITVEGAYAIDQTTINIDLPSTWFVTPGDVLCISFDPAVTVLAFNEYQILTVSKVGTSAGITQWLVTLDRGLHRALTDGEEIGLRAYPAYSSRPLKVPQSNETIIGVTGPYLFDWTSVPFVDQLEVVEYQTVQFLDNTLVPTGSPISMQKNTYILDVPIRADQFFFWDVVAGSLDYDASLKRVLGNYDTNGWFWLKHNAVPEIAVPSTPARGMLITPIKASFFNTDFFILSDDQDQVRFEYKCTGAYAPTAEVAAAGSITVNAIPADNDTFVLDNGFGKTVTFEFKRTVGFISSAAANKIVDVVSSALVTDIAVAMEAAVNAVNAILGITAVNTGPLLDLVNDEVSQLGNTVIVTTGAWAAPVVNFAGGTDKVETIDISAATIITAIQVANLTAAAINRSGLHVHADYTSLAPSVALTSTVIGPLGNGLIVESVFAAGFSAIGMSGGTGGKTWGFTAKAVAEPALLRVRFYPNAWQDFNLVADVDTPVSVTLASTDQAVERIDIFAVCQQFTGALTASGVPVNNDTLVLNNGIGTVTTYEFFQSLPFQASNPNNVIVDISVGPLIVAEVLGAAINVNTATTGISATRIGQRLYLRTAASGATFTVTGTWATLFAAFVGGTEIQMHDWSINRARVKALQHTYVAHVDGDRNFACTGAWAKAVFRSFDDLRLPFDNGGAYDAGYVMV